MVSGAELCVCVCAVLQSLSAETAQRHDGLPTGTF